MNAGHARGPNVLLVLADDLGWGDLGCYGAERIPTPNIDALAARGARFTDCHASSAVCTPSRYSLLTGRYAWRSPLRHGVLGGFDPSIIEADRPTLASVLGGAGYSTGAFGKWHLGLGWKHRDGTTRNAFTETGFRGDLEGPGFDIDYHAPFADGPLALGFDRFFGISGSLDMPPYCFLRDDHTVGVPDREKESYLPNQRTGLQVEDWADDQVDVRVCEEACTWITEQAEREAPFFAYVAAAAPHRPCVPPAFVQGASGAGVRGDAVCLVDWMVGQLVATLEQTGTLDDTIVIFASDNGAPLIYPEDGDIVEHRPNGPWRGQKADIWEAGHRVPLIVSWPGSIPAERTYDNPLCLTDVMPTLAQLIGIEVPQVPRRTEIDGVNLSALVTGAQPAQPAPTGDRMLVHHSVAGWFAVRQGDWKCILGTGSGGFSAPRGERVDPDSATGQLYNLSVDPAEASDLWAELPAVVASLHAGGAALCRDPASGYPMALQHEGGNQ